MSTFAKIKEFIADQEGDADKWETKKVKASGQRLRKAMQTLKILANELRTEILETNKAGKDS